MTLERAQVNCRCLRPDQFTVQRWPDGVVVYDDSNGSLHALNPVAGEAFTLLKAGHALDASSLARAMGLFDAEADELDMLHSLLMEFESMGLIACTQE